MEAVAEASEKLKAKDALPDQVSEALKEERYARLMALTARISAEKLAAKVGTTLDVIIDEVETAPPPVMGEVSAQADGGGLPGGGLGATGRFKADAPEIDGEVHLRDAGGLKPGDIVSVKVEDADEHDLLACPPPDPGIRHPGLDPGSTCIRPAPTRNGGSRVKPGMTSGNSGADDPFGAPAT